MTSTLYRDYFMKSRLPVYRDLLTVAKNSGYRLIGILDFYREVKKPDLDNNAKYLILRHDIDTSPKIAKKLFEIEREIFGTLGIWGGTYYIRTSTFDLSLINLLKENGVEIGYHYETIANFEKQHKLKSAEKILANMSAIRNQFGRELTRFREMSGVDSLSVSSHGDFVNRRLKLANTEVLKDIRTRQVNDIELEAYDSDLESHFDLRCADMNWPQFVQKAKDGFADGRKHIMWLIHPRNWKPDWIANTKDNFNRLYEGLRYSI